MAKFNPMEVPMNRRKFLAAGCRTALLALATSVFPAIAWATPKDARKKLAVLTGVDKPKKGRVTIVLPKTTDEGPMVPITISVDSPMTEEDYVKAVHLVGERNSVPEIASFYFNPKNRKAEVATRIRLKKTQTVVAAAHMSDGSVFIGKAHCKVLGGAGGCG